MTESQRLWYNHSTYEVEFTGYVLDEDSFNAAQ